MANKNSQQKIHPSQLTTDQVEKLRGVMMEIDNSYTRIDAERDYIKEALTDLADNYNLDKGHLGKLARYYHKQSIKEAMEEAETVDELHDAIFGKSKGTGEVMDEDMVSYFIRQKKVEEAKKKGFRRVVRKD